MRAAEQTSIQETTGAAARKLDPTDVALLAALRDDGRATVRSLASRLDVAPATVSTRMARLQADGVISGIHAHLDYRLLGYALCAYVALQITEITGLRGRVTREFLKLPEVEEFAWVTGEHDAIAKVWACDTEHLEAIVVRLDEIGCRSRTMLVLGTVHSRPGIDFDEPPSTINKE